MSFSKHHPLASAAVLAALLGLAAGPAAAGAGDWLLRAGVTTVAPDAGSDAIPATGDTLDVDDDTTLGFNVSYFVTDNVAIEVLAALPFTHMVSAEGGALSGADVVEIDHLPPTVSAQWHFLPSNNIRPYVGAGLTYFLILDDESQLGAGTDVSVDDGVGFAVQAGVDFDIAPNWFLNLDLRYISLSVDAEVSGAGAGVDGTYDVDIDPLVYTAAVGYKF
jgi:outer membrane protein